MTDTKRYKFGEELKHRSALPGAIGALDDGDDAARHSRLPSEPEQSFASVVGSAERRHLTVMFCDLVGSTALSVRLDPESLRELLVAYQETCGDVIAHHRGFLVRYLGDGILAYFGYPQAVEDAAVRAVRAGLEIVAAIRTLNDGPGGGGTVLAVRIGISSGRVVVGDIGHGEHREQMAVVGEAPNLAARLQSLAEPQTVIVGPRTHHLVNHAFKCRSTGHHSLKGFPDPVQAWQVVHARKTQSRFDSAVARGLTRFTGRHDELRTLRQCWRDARGGRLIVVNIPGDPGIGKSRLVHEFLSQLTDRAVRLEGHCTADGKTRAFLPFIDVMRRALGLEQTQTEDLLVESKLRQALSRLNLPPDQHLPYLSNLLGTISGEDARVTTQDPEAVGFRTRETLKALLRETCQRSPVILFINDLHWIDSASEGLLEVTIQAQAAVPMLILCTYRREYAPPWSTREETTEIALRPLTRQETHELAQARLFLEDLPEELVDSLMEWAEGNPLFAEEVLSHLMDTGDLAIEDERAVLAGGERRLGIPATLSDLLMQRIDRLDSNSRRLLQIASVVGRRFSEDLLRRASELRERTSVCLDTLEGNDLIVSEATQGSVRGFRFKHALVQEAVYDSLLVSDRSTIHEKVATAVEKSTGDDRDGVVETLAYHYVRTTRVDKAIAYLARAGENNLRVYSLDEAERQFRQVLELMGRVEAGNAELLLTDVVLSLARILYFRYQFREQIELVDRYLQHFEALGDGRRLSRILFETGYGHVHSGRDATGKMLLERALSIGESTGDDLCIGYASLGLMWYHVWWTRPDSALRATIKSLSERAQEAGRRNSDVWLTSVAVHGLASALAIQGLPGEASRAARDLIEMSAKTKEARPRSMGLSALAHADIIALDFERAVEHAEESLRLSLSPIEKLMARTMKAIALILMGEPEDGLVQLSSVRPLLVQGDFVPLLRWADLFRGVGIAMTGSLSLGVRDIRKCIRQFDQLGNRLGVGMGHLSLGEIYLRMSMGGERPPREVLWRNWFFLLRSLPVAAVKSRRHLEKAASAFREIDASSYVAWSLLNLGLLAKSENQLENARSMLLEARAIAESVDASALVCRITVALGEVT